MIELERGIDDVIVACSSGNDTNSAISVIRISGKNYLNQINHLFSIELAPIEPKTAYYCKLIDGDIVLDDIVLTYFKGPRSYNGEDIIELGVHGNILNVERILDILVENGCRRARGGEFSYRALKNNKKSLNQIEGLDMLLNANSVLALEQGMSLLGGELQKSYMALHKVFLKHRSSLELGFDFLDDVGEEAFNKGFKDSLEELKSIASNLYERSKLSNLNILNPEICLIGLPNAGKSTLFNNLLLTNRSIVSKEAGTTRDYVSEQITIDKNIYKLIDTAGLRLTNNEIEKEGIERSIGLIENSFFKILLINPFEFSFENFYSFWKNSEITIDLIIFTNSDRDKFYKEVTSVLEKIISGPMGPQNSAPIGPESKGDYLKIGSIGPLSWDEYLQIGSIGPKMNILLDIFNCNHVISMSLSGDKKENLFRLITSKYLKIKNNEPILVSRQSEAIKSVYVALSGYISLANQNEDISILGSELNIVGHCISELTGIISPDDILGNIFQNFCIGK